MHQTRSPQSIGHGAKVLVITSLMALSLACSTATHAPQPGSALEVPRAGQLDPIPVEPRLDVNAALEKIGFGSCLHQDDEQSILETVRGRNFDLFLMLGDNVYGDVTAPPDMRELREAYAAQAKRESFSALRSETPMLATWDDHDFGLNDAGATFPGREAAEQIFDDFWGIPSEAESRQYPGIYDAHLIGPPGRRTQILMLDTRYFRSDLTKSDRENWRYDQDADPEKTLLGNDQWRWLEEQLKVPADLRLLVSSIQILADGHGWEAWRTLPLERERLYEMIRRTGADGVIALSGDRHRAGIYRRDDVAPYPFFEITSSSLNRPSSSPEEPGPHRLGPSYRPVNFGAVHINWDQRTVRLEIADIDGETVLEQTVELDTLTAN